MPGSASLESVSASADWHVVKADEQKPESLLVHSRRAVFVFPWFRFVYAEGDNTREQRSSSLRTRF